MDDLKRHGGVVLAAVCLLVGLPVATVGVYHGDTTLFWSGLFLAVCGFIFGKPPNSEKEVDRRAEEFE